MQVKAFAAEKPVLTPLDSRSHAARRVLFTTCIAVVAALALLAQPGVSSADPSSFSLGVASGDVTSTSAILWAHADQAGSVTAEVDNDSDFSSLTDTIATSADPARDNTVHATTTALSPNTLYYYRFEGDPSVFSDVGTFKTAPSSSADQMVKFAWSGDADATEDPNNPGNPFFNNYETYGQMAAEGNDFNINLGDTIYSDSEVQVNEVQSVTIDATGGTYTLTFGSQTTSTIAFDATAATVQTDLRALSSIGSPNVTVLGAAGGPYTVTFQGALAGTNVAEMTSDPGLLTGGAGTATVATQTEGVPPPATALTRSAKWTHYKEGLALPALVNLREAGSVYSQWDDHEFRNDFSVAEFGSTIYKNGKDAFTDYAPVTDPNVSDPPDDSTDTGGYRTFRWGKNVQLFILDERSFRSAKASNDPGNPGVCDNGGSPDLGPTAPQDPTRNAFAALVPPLANPSPPGCVAEINSTSRTFLGATQLAQFKSDIANSDATFKVVVNETPIQQFYALPYDRWEGYGNERQDVLTYLNNQEDANNIVFLTTDTHANLINVVRFDTLIDDGDPDTVANDGSINTKMKEIVTGPVATNPFGIELNATVANPDADWLVRDLFFMPSPTAPAPFPGMGMECAQLNKYSYGEANASTYHLMIDLKDDAGNALMQNFHNMADYPCGPVDIHATSDTDGWSDEIEDHVLTDKRDRCPDNTSDAAYPPDLNNDTIVRTADISAVVFKYGQEGMVTGWQRYDLSGDDIIRTADITKVVLAYGHDCTN